MKNDYSAIALSNTWKYTDVHSVMPMRICQYAGKYAVLNKNICHFLGPSPSAISGKKSKAQKHMQMIQRCALDFSGKRAR